jgi:hypothetical protein
MVLFLSAPSLLSVPPGVVVFKHTKYAYKEKIILKKRKTDEDG